MCVFAVYMYVYGYVHVCAWCMCTAVYMCMRIFLVNVISQLQTGRQHHIQLQLPDTHHQRTQTHKPSAFMNE